MISFKFQVSSSKLTTVKLLIILLLMTVQISAAVVSGNFALVGFYPENLDSVGRNDSGVMVFRFTVENPNAAGTVGYRMTGISFVTSSDKSLFVEKITIVNTGSTAGETVVSGSGNTVTVSLNEVIAPATSEEYFVYLDITSDAMQGNYNIRIIDTSGISIERELDSGYTVLAEGTVKDFPFVSDTFSVAADSWAESFYNFPNPFNPNTGKTTIQYYLHSNSSVSVKVMDLSGRIVKVLADKEKQISDRLYKFEWDGKNEDGNIVISGLYYGVIKIGDEQFNTKIVVVK